MTQDWTPEQEHALAEVARIDQWEQDRLERIVRNNMLEGMSFQRGLMMALAKAERPSDDDSAQAEKDAAAKTKADDIKAKIALVKAKQRQQYAESLKTGQVYTGPSMKAIDEAAGALERAIMKQAGRKPEVSGC